MRIGAPLVTGTKDMDLLDPIGPQQNKVPVDCNPVFTTGCPVPLSFRRWNCCEEFGVYMAASVYTRQPTICRSSSVRLCGRSAPQQIRNEALPSFSLVTCLNSILLGSGICVMWQSATLSMCVSPCIKMYQPVRELPQATSSE